jgi:plastocyanin
MRLSGAAVPEGNDLEPMKARRSMAAFCPGTRNLRALARVAVALALGVCALVLAATDAQARDGDPTIVSLSLSKYTSVQAIEAGSTVGVRPGLVRVHVGDRVVFVNDDTDHHTATALLNAATFVDDPRWTDEALHAAGAIGAGFWSTGDLAPVQKSQPLVAKKAGTFLFGCFFDYGAGMRGEIIVEP